MRKPGWRALACLQRSGGCVSASCEAERRWFLLMSEFSVFFHVLSIRAEPYVLGLFPFVSYAQISVWNPNLVSLGLTQRHLLAGQFTSPCLSLQAGSFRKRQIAALSSVLEMHPLSCLFKNIIYVLESVPAPELNTFLASVPSAVMPAAGKSQWRVRVCWEGQGVPQAGGAVIPWR